ncbi:unnamed protein product [Symbiodinium sp. CCMP2592]|nr:unnamed protein product [Symbiodinium sp. CCMP2592]
MFKILKEIADDKERCREHDQEVKVSARVTSKGSAEALQENLVQFADDLTQNAATLGTDGKIKLPKRKKNLTPEQETDKGMVALFKKLLQDDAKLGALIADLTKVPHSAELSKSLESHKETVKNIINTFDEESKVPELDMAGKKRAMEKAQDAMKPVYVDIKEGNRRCKAHGVKPSKGGETSAGRDQQERLSNAYAEFAAACRAERVRRMARMHGIM